MGPVVPRVAVVVLNWNGWRDTVECLESVLRTDYRNYFVVVCDNASTDGSPARIGQWAKGQIGLPPGGRAHLFESPLPRPIPLIEWTGERALPPPASSLTLLRNEANLGFAGGNNAGIRFALQSGADYIWLLNNDTVVEADAIREMVNCMEAFPAVGICGATLLDYRLPDRIQTRGGYRYRRWCARCAPVGTGREDTGAAQPALDYVAGASMFVRRSFVEAVGLMEERYFLYFEELDWAMRGRKAFRLGYCRQARVYHKEGKSIGSGDSTGRSLAAEYFGSRNRVRVTLRFWPWYVPAVLLSLCASAVQRAFHRRWTHAGVVLAAACGVSPDRFPELRRLHRATTESRRNEEPVPSFK
jgi:GT2 family glycosyltransferase